MIDYLTLSGGDAAAQAAGSGSMWTMLIVYGVFILALYLIFFRPQSKKKKKEEKMRKSAQIGDEIITIGGICGRIVAIKEDTESIVLETGTDRSRILLKRWAIGSVQTIHDDGE